MTTLPEVARSIAAMPDEDALEALIAQLPALEVVAFLYSVEQVAHLARQAVRFAESRVLADGLLAHGESWDAPDGTAMVWAGDRRRECSDTAGLRDALKALPYDWGVLARNALRDAFVDQPPKLMLTPLDRLVKLVLDDEVGETVRSFVTWKEGPAHLRPVEREGR